MSYSAAVDSQVKLDAPTPPVEADDSFTNLFFDRTISSGVRVLAVAEPVHRTPHGYFTAATALASFEEALVVAIKVGIEHGLDRAFAAANEAVRGANRGTASSLRTYAGITAVAIDGQQATIGYVPPGQALIFQDGRIYGVPDLATWKPGFMPWSDCDEPEPLGFDSAAHPCFRRTTIGSGDQLMLGASAVGRVLANPGLGPLSDLSEAAVLDRVEKGLAASGVDDAFAAWIRCDQAPVTVAISDMRMAEIENVWRGQPARSAAESIADLSIDPRIRRAVQRDQMRIWLIETSERLFGRRDAERIPLETRRRASAPLSGGSLHRFVAPHTPSLTPWFRARLPRGLRLPHSKRSLAGLLGVLLLVASLAITHNVRDTRAARQDRVLNVAKAEILEASAATSKDEAQPHIELAERSLGQALANGADADVIEDWRNDLGVVVDRWNGVGRFTEMKRIGTLPQLTGAQKPQLILVDHDLYMIAGGVYLVSESDRVLMPMLQPGDRIDGTKVHSVVSATIEGGQLLVTDGISLFRLDENRTWTVAKLASSGRAAGWITGASGAYNGSYFLFDSSDKQVKKFDGDQLDDEPVDWLTDKALKHAAHTVDMAVKSDVYLLTTDGTVYTFVRGNETDKYEIADASEKASMVGLYGGGDTTFLYVVEIDNKNGELVRFDAATQLRTLYLMPLFSQDGYDAGAAKAFGETVDFVIDEASGVVYFVTTSGLWRASIV